MGLFGATLVETGHGGIDVLRWSLVSVCRGRYGRGTTTDGGDWTVLRRVRHCCNDLKENWLLVLVL